MTRSSSFERVSPEAGASGHSTLAFAVAGLVLVAFGAVNFQQQKIWKDGESLWTHVIKFEGKTSPTAWANRAQIYRDRGDFERGLADFNVVIDEITAHQPKLGDFNSRGKCYFDMATGAGGKYASRAPELLQKAMADYNRAVELVKDTADHKSIGELYINRGAAFGATGNMAQAVVEISKGIAADPTNENGYLNRSLAYYNLREFENALKDYSKYLELDPFYTEMYYERGLCEMQLGRTAEAEADFSTAITKAAQPGTKKLEASTKALFFMERARARAALGRKAEAQADVAEAGKLGLQPDQDVLNRLAK